MNQAPLRGGFMLCVAVTVEGPYVQSFNGLESQRSHYDGTKDTGTLYDTNDNKDGSVNCGLIGVVAGAKVL